MNILIISRGAITPLNNTGNTILNIFSCLENVSLHNLILRDENPCSNLFKSNFILSEAQLIKNLLNPSIQPGRFWDESSFVDSTLENNMYQLGKKTSSYFPWLIREMIWSIPKWKNTNLKQYIQSVSPDIIFMPVFNCSYPYKVLKYIKKNYNDAKVILFHADNNYSLKHWWKSPFFMIHRLQLRSHIKKTIRYSDLNFAISEPQLNDYKKIFKKDFFLLQKFKMTGELPKNNTHSNTLPLKISFTGNISSGRWKTITKLISAIKTINNKFGKRCFVLDIYTGSTITKKMHSALNVDEISFLHKPVSNEEVDRIREESDILLHVESFNIFDKEEVKYSFSTKLIDYFYKNKCVFAIGPKTVASISVLKEYGIAEIAELKKAIPVSLEKLLNLKYRESLEKKAYAYAIEKNGLIAAKNFKSLIEGLVR